MTPTTQKVCLALFAFAVLLAVPSVVAAHGLGADATLKGDQVHVEGYFDDDTAAAGARVWVEDAEKKRVAEGRMDTQGRWSFPAPAPGRYCVTVDAGAGHRATVTLAIPAANSADPLSSGSHELPDADRLRVSEGQPREEFTRFPWLGLAAGLVLLGTLAIVVPHLLRAARGKAAPEEEKGSTTRAPRTSFRSR